jgi:hypothetical protein
LPGSFKIEENYNLASYDAGRLLTLIDRHKVYVQQVEQLELNMRQKEHVGDKGVQ